MADVRYRYQSNDFGDYDIHYRSLKNRNQFEDIGGIAEALGISSASWPLFGMVWPSGEILAQLMANYDLGSRRILEVGCGVGLASLVLNKRLANISATDSHPLAHAYLDHNTLLNHDREIPFFRADWDDSQDLSHGDFDLVIGSDLLYERQHNKLLSIFIEYYARATSEVIIVDGGRGFSNKFTELMEANGFRVEVLDAIAPFTNPEKFKGKILRYRRCR
jgi:predicted nicotinamide N-methyase